MARPNKIRQAGREADVLKLAGKGKTSRQIAAELTKSGLDVSHVAVARFLEEERTDRKAAVQQVVAQQAQKTIPLAIEALERAVRLTTNVMQWEYVGEGNGGTKDKPKPRVRNFVSAAKAVTGAARALHAVTSGDDPDGSKTNAALSEAHAILAAKRKREAAEKPEG